MIQKVKGGYQVLSSKGKHSAVPIRLLKPRRNGCGKWSFSSIAKDSSPRNKCRGAGHGGAKRNAPAWHLWARCRRAVSNCRGRQERQYKITQSGRPQNACWKARE